MPRRVSPRMVPLTGRVRVILNEVKDLIAKLRPVPDL